MKISFLGLGLLVASMTVAPAQAPATDASPAPQQNQESTQPKPVAKASHKKEKNPAPSAPAVAAAPVSATAPAKACTPVFENFLKALNDNLVLSPNEKTEIQSYYLADAPALDQILNDPALSPLQQAKHVSDLRDERNAKVSALLVDVDRRREFLQVESQYRVALTDAAADGLIVAPAPAPADAKK